MNIGTVGQCIHYITLFVMCTSLVYALMPGKASLPAILLILHLPMLITGIPDRYLTKVSLTEYIYDVNIIYYVRYLSLSLNNNTLKIIIPDVFDMDWPGSSIG